MLKPDYIDIDGDGNKTEPMKTAAKQRDMKVRGGLLDDDREQYVLGGISRGISKAISKMTGKGSKPKMSQKELEDALRESEFEMDKLMEENMNSPEGLTGSKLDYAEEVEDLSNQLINELKNNYPESEILKRIDKAEGGDVDGQMSMLMMTKKPKEDMMPEEDMLPDNEMEDEYLDFILDEALDNEEEDFLMDALQGNDRLSMIFDKVIDVAQEFAGSGPVEGPGSGVSDSIPARLSDGEFVFTAKAVEEIGEDTLMSMMKDAEVAADERQGLFLGGTPDEEEIEDEESNVSNDMRKVNPRLNPNVR